MDMPSGEPELLSFMFSASSGICVVSAIRTMFHFGAIIGSSDSVAMIGFVNFGAILKLYNSFASLDFINFGVILKLYRCGLRLDIYIFRATRGVSSFAGPERCRTPGRFENCIPACIKYTQFFPLSHSRG